MDIKKKWTSPQSLIILAIVLLIFVYIGVDMAKVKPSIKSDLNEVKQEYVELSDFLDQKIPEIETTLKTQAEQISSQSKDINALNEKVSELGADK
jgi:predicted PurR-regulated permease PerM